MVQLKQYDSAAKVLRNTKSAPDGAYAVVIMGFSRVAHLRKGLAVYSLMGKDSRIRPGPKSICAAIRLAAKCNAAHIAFKIYNETVASGVSRDNHILCALLSSCGLPGTNMTQADNVWKLFFLGGIEPREYAYCTFIDVCSKFQDLDRALELLIEAHYLRGLPLNSHLLSSVLNACAVNDDALTAFSICKSLDPDRSFQSLPVIQSTLVKCLANSGQLVQGAQLFKRQRSHCSNSIVSLLRNCPDVESIDELWMLSLTHLQPQAHQTTFAAFISAYMRVGQLSSAVKILKEAVNLKLQIRTQCFYAFLSGIAESDDIELFLELMSISFSLSVPIGEYILNFAIKVAARSSHPKACDALLYLLDVMHKFTPNLSAHIRLAIYSAFKSRPEWERIGRHPLIDDFLEHQKNGFFCSILLEDIGRMPYFCKTKTVIKRESSSDASFSNPSPLSL